MTGETPYLLIYDNEEISKLELKEKLSSAKVLASDVKSTVFPKEYGTLDYVYYTKDISKENQNAGLSGNKLFKLNTKTGESVEIQRDEQQTLTLVAYEFGNLYYKKLKDGRTHYYSNSFVAGESEKQLTYIDETSSSSISDFTPINKDNYVFKYNSKIMLNDDLGGALVDKDATIELVYGDYVYYSTSDGIYRISYKDKNEQTVIKQENIKQGAMEIAGEYLYYYAQTTNNSTNTYYCHRANNKIIEDGRTSAECIAEVLADDITENS